MRKATAKNLNRGKKRVAGRRRTMRGGREVFANVKDACAKIAAAADANAKKKIYREAALQFHPDKGGDVEAFKELQMCSEDAEGYAKKQAAERAERQAPPPAARPAPQPAPAQPPQAPNVPDIEVGKLTPEVWATSDERAKQLVYDFIRSYPKRFFKEVFKTANFLLVSASPGATREQIKDAMKQAGIEKPQRQYMFDLIQKTYNPSYPLQTNVTVLTPV